MTVSDYVAGRLAQGTATRGRANRRDGGQLALDFLDRPLQACAWRHGTMTAVHDPGHAGNGPGYAHTSDIRCPAEIPSTGIERPPSCPRDTAFLESGGADSSAVAGGGRMAALLKAVSRLPPEQLEALLAATAEARREADSGP